MKIIFIQTGGTIDKDYPHATRGWAFEYGEPAISRMIEKLNPSFEYEVLTAFQKDSLEITDKERESLTALIKGHSENNFIVTHGTDTMIETSVYLNKHIKDKLIILTGAMRPERFSNSDAPINFGAAVAATNLIDKGIFIAMHGIVKNHSEIKRNLKTGKFY